jgi:ankyrin repeat protein
MRRFLAVSLVLVLATTVLSSVAPSEVHPLLRSICYQSAGVFGSRLLCAASRPARDDALRFAVMNSDVPRAEALIAAGAEPSSDGRPALKYMTTPLHSAAFRCNQAMVEMLLRRGADPNRWGEGGVPLAIAAEHCDEKLVRTLLNGGADPSGRRSSDGTVVLMNTPLEAAQRSQDRRIEKLLRERGASPRP